MLNGMSSAPSAGCQSRLDFKAIRELCSSDPQKPEAIQSDVWARFQEYFAKGYAAVGFDFSATGRSYLLEPYED
jgi:hypothetical protein